MESIEIKGTIRKGLGKSFTKKLRKEEKVPCILYGGKENVLFQVEEKSLKSLVYTPNVYSVNFDIDGKKYKAVQKDIQFHPVSDDILHVDFLEIFDNKPVSIGIPVLVTGNSEGVKQGGKMHLKKRKLIIKGLLADLPNELTIDITNLELGKSIKIKDLAFDNLELLEPANDVVCSVKLTRVAKGMEEGIAEGGEEAEGGEATATAEGAEAEAKQEAAAE